MTDVDMLKFLICIHVGCPHPRYLDEYLIPADLGQWSSFFEWYYRKPQHA